MRGRLRDRPVLLGTIGGGALVLVVALVVILPQVWFYLRTNDYAADVANASDLAAGDQVYVAGVADGRVTGVDLAGDHVHVTFRLDDGQRLGSETTASIKIATILGRRYLAVAPAGPGTIETIPENHTTVPYTLDELGRDATGVAQQLNLQQIQQALSTVATSTGNDPNALGKALQGVSAVSGMISRRNGQIGTLLSGARTLTQTLVSQQQSLDTLLGNADLVAQTLAQRQAEIRQLIADVGDLTTQLTTFLRNNTAVLNPLLTQLHQVGDALTADDNALSGTLTLLAPTSRYLANASGNGNWGDVEGPAGPIPDNLLCLAGLIKGCG